MYDYEADFILPSYSNTTKVTTTSGPKALTNPKAPKQAKDMVSSDWLDRPIALRHRVRSEQRR
jgi:hypothetical protein